MQRIWVLFLTPIKELAHSVVEIVSELGNYGDLYEKHLESILPRKGLNTVYDKQANTNGLMFHYQELLVCFATTLIPTE